MIKRKGTRVTPTRHSESDRNEASPDRSAGAPDAENLFGSDGSMIAAAEEGGAADAELEKDDDLNAEPAEPLRADTLTERVYQSFSKKRREEIPISMVREVVEALDLTGPPQEQAVPRLKLSRLRFTGEKHLNDGTRAPIDYDQLLGPGVNVVLITDNLVGKSSIFKTIKFALTGDDSDYDNDVRSWIRDVWLQFSLDQQAFTIHLSRGELGLGGYIAAGHTVAPTAKVEAVLHAFRAADEVRRGLHEFFMHAFGLTELSWTQASPTGAEKRTATWRTFFQALVIPDSSEEYLVLDAEHAMGNQVGLILSVFLGLSLVEPLNELLVERQKATAETKTSAAEREKLEGELERLLGERRVLEQDLKGIEDAQRARRIAVLDNPDARRHRELITAQAVKFVEVQQLKGRYDEQNTMVRRLRGQARSLREAITLRRHFTGLEVSLCPNCDTDVDEAAVEREQHQHLCRLCGKEARPATDGDLESMEAEAQDLERRADEQAELRESLGAQHRAAQAELEQLDDHVRTAATALEQGPEYALPTGEEDARRSSLLQDLGELRGRITHVIALLDRAKAGTTDAELRAVVRSKVREVLQGEAKRRNAGILRQLGALVGEMTARIGAESISDVSVSPVGALSLQKNGVRVKFSSIRNPGERLRVKLAFFLAMMRLGRVRGAGRHPGFLMIDQPGSDEMVEEDFAALASVLRDVDLYFADELQILCFTARPQFAEATAEGKVYGPTAGKFAF